MSKPLRPHGLQHARLPCPSPIPRACSNLGPSSWWCHSAISSSVVPFSSCLQCFPAPGSFPISGLFATGGESFRASASASVLPMNIQGWFPLGLTGLISLQSRGFSRVFSSTTVQKQDPYLCQVPLAGRNPGGLACGIDDLSSTKWTYLLLSCICSRTALLQRLHQNHTPLILLRARSPVLQCSGKVSWSLPWSPRI